MTYVVDWIDSLKDLVGDPKCMQTENQIILYDLSYTRAPNKEEAIRRFLSREFEYLAAIDMDDLQELMLLDIISFIIDGIPLLESYTRQNEVEALIKGISDMYSFLLKYYDLYNKDISYFISKQDQYKRMIRDSDTVYSIFSLLTRDEIKEIYIKTNYQRTFAFSLEEV